MLILLVSDARINSNVGLLFVILDGRMLFGNESIVVEHVFSVIDLLLPCFFAAFMFDYFMLVRDLSVCFCTQITRIFYFVLIYVATRVGMTTTIWCLCFNAIHAFLYAFRRAMF